MTTTTCRILQQAQRASALATDLGTALRQLRTYQDDCTDCQLRGTCQAPAWNAALNEALHDIAEEWGLI